MTLDSECADGEQQPEQKALEELRKNHIPAYLDRSKPTIAIPSRKLQPSTNEQPLKLKCLIVEMPFGR
jgi:hypothetical protein